MSGNRVINGYQLTAGGDSAVLALTTASTVSGTRFKGPCILTPSVACYVRSGSSVTSASSGDQYLAPNLPYGFMVNGYVAAAAAATGATGSLYVTPCYGLST